MTLPVLFLMLTSHAPFASTGPYNWLVATLLIACSGLLKHFHSCMQKKQPAAIYLTTGLLLFSAAIMFSGMGSVSLP